MTHTLSNVADFLLEGRDHERTALIIGRREYSYGELSASAERVARVIELRGGEKGDRAVLIAENTLFWVASYLGILRAGLVCVPLPAAISRRDLDCVLRQTEPRLIFAQSSIAGLAETEPGKVLTEADLAAVSAGAPLDGARPDVEPGDLAALMFTSGSTGQPRGVMVSHANIIANTESIIDYLGLTAADRIMAVLPFHYCFGTSLLHSHLRVGGSLVVEPRFVFPEMILNRMMETGCTGFAGVPSHFQLLMRNSSLRKRTFPELRYVQQSGGHLAPSFIREMTAALPSTQFFVMYGQTEATARLSYLPPEYLSSKLGSIGRGMPGVTLQVLDQAGEEVRLGEISEIVARGANVACGYWRAPGETAAVFRDGALYTGDLATVDTDGFIYIVDRARDVLKCGGKRVSCRRIEDELLDFDELLERP
jgi:long-chain acyl-CoA synthetase